MDTALRDIDQPSSGTLTVEGNEIGGWINGLNPAEVTLRKHRSRPPSDPPVVDVLRRAEMYNRREEGPVIRGRYEPA